jgi:tRNA nucleotidyltransferase (CCA-adding enzyme)
VRDGLLGRLGERPDLDLVVPEDAVALTRGLRRQLGGSCVVLDAERSIARLVLTGWTIDLARCAGGGLEADLLRRDYTVNAIALPLLPEGGGAGLVDPSGGLIDLEAGRLAAIREANLLDDPLRLLRGLRLQAELGFALDAVTWDWIRRHHDRLGAVAGERVVSELERLAAAPGGDRGLARVLEAGLLRPWTANDAFGALDGLDAAACRHRGLTEAEAAAALPLARLAGALDEAALDHLPLSRSRRQRCRRLRHWRQRIAVPGGQGLARLGEAERLRLHREIEHDLPALLLSLAPEEAITAIRRWRDPADPLFHPRAPIDGSRLQRELGLPAGPLLGELIAHLTRERAFGRLAGAGGAGNHADAQTLTAARQWLALRIGPAA